MATMPAYIEYVCEQLEGCGDIRYKKMFGEYMVYINDKPIILVCDNTVFVKQLPCIAEQMMGADKGFPYEGAKEHYILDIDNAVFCKRIIGILELQNALPKQRRKKSEMVK